MIWVVVFPTLTVLNAGGRADAPKPAGRRPHLRPRDGRGADRHLRPDVTPARAPRATPHDSYRFVRARNDGFSRRNRCAVARRTDRPYRSGILRVRVVWTLRFLAARFS